MYCAIGVRGVYFAMDSAFIGLARSLAGSFGKGSTGVNQVTEQAEPADMDQEMPSCHDPLAPMPPDDSPRWKGRVRTVVRTARRRGRRFSVGALLVLCAAFLSENSVDAQATGGLSGTVQAAPGKPLQGARVTLTVSGISRIYAATTTSSNGAFFFAAVVPGVYDLKVEAANFGAWMRDDIRISPGAETSLEPVALVPGNALQLAKPEASGQFVETGGTSAESSLDPQQVSALPVSRRNAQDLIALLPGVQENGRASAIYGESPSAINIAFDGVNIEQSFVNTRTIDALSLPLHTDQIEEATVATGAIFGCGCSQVSLSTKRQGNSLHGSGYWLTIPSATAAQFWSSNANNAPASTSLNRLGASLGGALKKDKLFFFANYEGDRDGSTITQIGQVPTAPITSQDPLINKVLALMPTSASGVYRGSQQSGGNDNFGLVRLDYFASPRNIFGLTLSGAHSITDDPADSSVFGNKPDTTIAVSSGFYSAFWRSSLTSRLTNEARAGASLPEVDYRNSLRSQFGFIAILNDPGVAVSQPMTGMDPQGRHDFLYSYQDTLTWVAGKHTVQFGGWFQQYRLNTYGYNNGLLDSVTVPRYVVNDIAAGTITEEDQRFNITSPTSGYSAGSTPRSRLSANMTSPFFLDTWRVTPTLTLTIGARYDYLSPADERTGTAIVPIVPASFAAQTAYDQNLSFGYFSSQHPFYVRDLDNISPYAGIAWKPFRKLPLVIRGSGNNSYTPAELLPNMSIYALRNPYQSFDVSTVLGGIPLSQAPVTATPVLPSILTLQSLLNFANSYHQAPGPVLAIDPELRTPNIHYWTFGIESHAAGFDWRVRFVENGLEEGPRLVNRNGIQYPPGYLATFLQVQSQLNSTGSTTGFPLLPGGGVCANFSLQNCQPDLHAISLIQTGQAGALAQWYMAQGYHPDTSANYYFLGNPLAPGGLDLLSKLGDSQYDGLEFTAMRRLAAGLGVTVNYMFSKVRSNLDDYQQGAVDPYLDLHNPALEWATAPFNQTQVFRLYWTWELPFFKSSRSTRGLREILANWSVSGIATVQSGAPFSLLSGGYVTLPNGQVSEVTGLGTFGSQADSGQNPVTTSLTGPQIQQFLGVRENPGGTVSYVNAPAGAFEEPAPGTLGNLPRRMFTGPVESGLNVSLRKTVALNERTRLELRGEAINLLNNVNWLVGDQTFLGSQGQKAVFNDNVSQSNAPRQLQFMLRLQF
jgi:hypothetical protein